jgi:hypothetical protein
LSDVKVITVYKKKATVSLAGGGEVRIRMNNIEPVDKDALVGYLKKAASGGQCINAIAGAGEDGGPRQVPSEHAGAAAPGERKAL